MWCRSAAWHGFSPSITRPLIHISCLLLFHDNSKFNLFLQAALQLTEAQKEQMMHIRVLFYGKLGALRRHRKKLLQQVRFFHLQ